jgi:hypothetical protein
MQEYEKGLAELPEAALQTPLFSCVSADLASRATAIRQAKEKPKGSYQGAIQRSGYDQALTSIDIVEVPDTIGLSDGPGTHPMPPGYGQKSLTIGDDVNAGVGRISWDEKHLTGIDTVRVWETIGTGDSVGIDPIQTPN